MIHNSWSHGYYTSALYTYGFYREMAPNWLDFAALVKGHRPPREDGVPFRYLELGSGMGLHLCLLAGAYPEGEFVGVDFHVDHIANSLRLKHTLKLKNVDFVHADVLDLPGQDRPARAKGDEQLRQASFHYVACHGMFSWVEQSVQTSILAASSKFLRIGGLLYLSYNVQPGWMPHAVFQHLAEGERRRFSTAQPMQAYQRAMEVLSSLVGNSADENQNTPLYSQQPTLSHVIKEVSSIDPRYMLHEYANPNWRPVWVDEAHSILVEHQLRHLGSANLPELFPELLPPFVKTIIDSEPESTRKELYIDLALCRRFRRDIFFFGYNPLTKQQRSRLLGNVVIRSLSSLKQEFISFTTGYGDIAGDPVVFGEFDGLLQKGDATVAELAIACEREIDAMPVLLSLAINSGKAALARRERPPSQLESAKEMNEILLREATEGEPFGFVIAPDIGTAVSLELHEAILLQLNQEGVQREALAFRLIECLDRLEQRLQARGQGTEGNQLALAEEAIRHFATTRIPFLNKAGLSVNLL